MPLSSTSISAFIMSSPSSTNTDDRYETCDALSLRSWEWKEHGYNKRNANEAFNLFRDKGVIHLEEKNVSFRSVKFYGKIDNGKHCKIIWAVRKKVSVPSLNVCDVPIEGTGMTEEDAECQCNLMILGELYRNQVIEKAENEIQNLPTDIHTITTRMKKFEIPKEALKTSLPNTPTSGTASQILAHPSRSRINNPSSFLGNIQSKQNHRFNGGDGVRRDRENEYRFHPDLKRRKFAAQKKTIDEVIDEQCQVNVGRVRQADIPVHVSGGTNDVHIEQIKLRSFDDIQLTQQLQTTLHAINYNEPTNLQKIVIPLIQRTNNDILCLAATGSGKSGAFLIPLVHRFQGLRIGPRGEQRPVNRNAPMAIIVAHTKELVQQLYDNARTFAYETQVGVAIARGQMTNRDCHDQLENGCEILIITPGKLNQFLEENWIQLSNVQFLVIDEVDKFINDDQMVKVIYKLHKMISKSKNVCYRTLMFSATFDESAEFVAEQLLRTGYYQVVTKNINQAVEHVRQKVYEVDCTKFGRNPRLVMLKNLLKSYSLEINEGHFRYETPKTIVFVNEGRTSDRVAIALSYWGFKAMSTSGHRSMEQRYKAVEDFKKGLWPILVSTDLNSRGINLPNVKTVIIYEMPPINRAEQYIHRVGRIGRVGDDDVCAFVFFDPESRNDEQLAEFLFDQLRGSNQHIPKFLKKMLAEKAKLERMLQKQQNAIRNDRMMPMPDDPQWNNVQWDN